MHPKHYRDTPCHEDVTQVGDLVRQTGFFSDEECQIASELVQETLDKGPAAGYEFLFVDGPGGLLGYACFGRIPCTESCFDLYWIAVDPAQQGQGLGRRLMDASEAKIHAQGGTQVFVDTAGREQYQPTRAFYERCGYELAARLEDFYAPGDAKCLYRKWLR